MASMYYPPAQNMWPGMGQPPQGQMYPPMPGMHPGFGQGPILVDGCDDALMPEQAIQIYALRSRATSGNSPMELAAAGRSAVVAEMFKVSSKTVKNIWTRKCWTDVTAPYWTEHETLMYECDKVKSTASPESSVPSTPLSRQSSFNSNASFSASFGAKNKPPHPHSFKNKMGGSFRGRQRRHSVENVSFSRSQSPEARAALSEHGGSKRNLMDLVGFDEPEKLFPENRASKRRASIAEETEDDMKNLHTEPRHPPVGSPLDQNTKPVPSSEVTIADGVSSVVVSPVEFDMRTSSSSSLPRAGSSGVEPVHSEQRALPPVCGEAQQQLAAAKAAQDAASMPAPAPVQPKQEPAQAGVEAEAPQPSMVSGDPWTPESLFDSLGKEGGSDQSFFFRTISTALKRTASRMWDVSRTSSISSIWNRTLSSESTMSKEGMGEAPPAGSAFPLDLNENGVARGASIAERVDMLLEETSRASVSDEEFQHTLGFEPHYEDDEEPGTPTEPRRERYNFAT